MSRTYPYRQRIPTHILQLLDVASRITLFQVGQSGPLSFTFTDRLQKIFKVSIGATPTCTCVSRPDHCIHTLYTLLKIFKLPSDCALLWQNAYLDSQLTDIVEGKYVKPQRPPVCNDVMPLPPLSYDFIDRVRVRNTIDKMNLLMKEKQIVVKMQLTAQSLCPICQQVMEVSKQPLSHCTVKCGNNFHLACLKIWAEHNTFIEHSITCPMCRTSFEPDFLERLEREEIRYKQENYKRELQFYCANCTVKIESNPHKCLLCEQYELCICCYDSNKHLKHSFICMNNALQWHGARERRESQLKIISYIENKKKEENHNVLLSRIREIESNPSKLNDFLCSPFPYVSKYISQHIDPYKKMDFEMSAMVCMVCKSNRMLHMRRLTCGHFVDHECLKSMIQKGRFHCLVDGTQILKGYEQLKRREKKLEIDYNIVEEQKEEGGRRDININVNIKNMREINEEYERREEEVDQEVNSLTNILFGRRKEAEIEVVEMLPQVDRIPRHRVEEMGNTQIIREKKSRSTLKVNTHRIVMKGNGLEPFLRINRKSIRQ